MTYIVIFLFGSMIGSFLNVCIYRIPRDESIIFPASRCTSCKKPIKWYDNIPLLSYIFLKGKCRSCNEKISPRYFIVELSSALSFLILYVYFGASYKFFIYSILVFNLVIVSFIDLEFQIIPDRISIGGILLGLVLSSCIPELHNSYVWIEGLLRSLLGVLTGGFLLYFMLLLGNLGLLGLRHFGIRMRKNPYWRKKFAKYRHMKESMGFGDVKLMAMLGAFLGWEKTVLVFFLAPFLGTIPGLYFKFKKKSDIIPYGPFISLASIVVMIWGDSMISYILF
ncbi:MAG: prepilin peptidase [Candidatus Omnitrophota bacterium]